MDTADATQTAAGVAAVAISVVALLVSWTARVDTRTQLLTDIRQRWEELSTDWATVLLLWDGGRTYYSDAAIQERKRVAKLVDRFNRPGRYVSDPLFEVRSETAHLRKIARFFAYVSDAVLRGKLSVMDAYAVFGPDVARHHHAALWIAGRELIGDGRKTFYDVRATYPEWATFADEITESGFADEQAAIVLLLWLCAGVQAQRGDTSAHLLLARARYFVDSGEYHRVANSMFSLSLLRGSVPWRPGLRRILRFAAMVPYSRAFDAREEPLVGEEDVPYARFRLRRHIRRATSQTENAPPW